MDYKYYSGIFIIIAFLTHIFGLLYLIGFLVGLIFFLLGFFCIIYTQHKDVEELLSNSKVDNPLDPPRPRKLVLNLVCEQKPIVLITPNIKIQTESKKKNRSPQHLLTSQQQQSSESRKKGLIDSGIELLFKKHGKNVKDGQFKAHDVYLESRSASDEKKWKPFENIKIHTDKKKQCAQGSDKLDAENIQFGEDCSGPSIPPYNLSLGDDGHLLNENGSPKNKQRTMLTGNKQIDQKIHTIIDFIIRDFIDSWYCALSDNKEFSEFRVQNSIEECISNISNRVKNTQWIPLMTTKLIDNLANHTRFYRLANQAINSQSNESLSKGADKQSPQRKSKKAQHKRNKSDTDLEWYFGSNPPQKNVANSKFYTELVDEKVLADPELNLLTAFFNQSDTYKKEIMDDLELEKYLTHIMQTILYFALPEEDFACIPLRRFLSAILASAALKPLLEMLADPDFINLQVAKLFSKEPPPVEYFMKALRQSTDLSELRACRQLITKEMNLKYKDPTASTELASLRYTQKLIDLRINNLQNSKDIHNIDRDRLAAKLPILSLDELLFKELARYYFLDYLSLLNLQKYVIFYLTADEWKCFTNQTLAECSKSKSSREEAYRTIREKAKNIFNEYLEKSSQNCLDVDSGLVEALSIKLKDYILPPDGSWFDSICKFIYEKLKNEEIFLTKFYQSSAYKKLLLELEFFGHNNESDLDNPLHSEAGSDTNSGDINFEDEISVDLIADKPLEEVASAPDLLEVASFKHSRSHSDCTGIVQSFSDLNLKLPTEKPLHLNIEMLRPESYIQKEHQERAHSAPSRPQIPEIHIENKQKLTAKIINTAILCEGQYAVYAIQVVIIEDNQEKSWHIYRRYSKFLELKKILVKKYPFVAKVPFPAKKTFQNTQRSVLEHRMVILNEFLRIICEKVDNNEDMMRIVREFLEPDTDDRKIHGGVVIRTLETIVNPLKTGMRTIRNMPDTLVGSFSKLLLGKGPLKEPTFLEVNYLEESSEYPALTSALRLLDEVFDLQARSQWLRRGIINRILGAPWVSQTANKKIIQGAKSIIEVEKLDKLLASVLDSIWPEGQPFKRLPPREDNTKLRTRVGARMALFALLSDDLKHLVGSETTRSGLFDFFTMWQQKKLNLRLVLVLLNDILTTLFNVDSLTKHIDE